MKKVTLSEPGTSSGTTPGAETQTLERDPGRPAMVPSLLGFGQGLSVSWKNRLCLPWAEVIISDNVTPGAEATHNPTTGFTLAKGSSVFLRPPLFLLEGEVLTNHRKQFASFSLLRSLWAQASGDSHQASITQGPGL